MANMIGFLSSKKALAIFPVVLLSLVALSFAPAAHAHGPPDWQATFSGNCNDPTHCFGTRGGFWGWCAFGGGTGSPATSGNNADCQSEGYSHGEACETSLCVDAHFSVSGTAWDIEPSAFNPSVNDFFITDGFETLSGPTIVHALASGALNLPQPPCVVSGQSITCPLSVLEAAGIYGPDTGVVATPGHMSNSICADGVSAPGCHYNQQVTQIP
jgi:hypothetical protein